ncbi:acyltransferase [Photobacterium sp. DA100]|uniref:acyltransferase n=1 Tax=Photobacterium sp. DA100 TaxID=3027472 RepID=UPI002479B0ED|nr:acyltransferase [Photobacterium sp. DA100]WEM41555.1 acyltransferase [Photobacterium sp. DA100]
MNGRNLFKRLKFVFNVLDKLIGLLPFFIRSAMFSLFSGFPGKLGVAIRYVLLRSLARSCGENVYVGRWCTIKNFECLNIGSNVSLHEYCYIDAKGELNIGDNVSIAHGCSILTFEHTFDDANLPIKYQELKLAAVSISDDVWLGCGVRVLAGSVIEARTVIGANSVVRNTLESGVYVGSPARKVRPL